MTFNRRRHSPGSISLAISDFDSPALNEVRFNYDETLGTIRSVRGRTGGVFVHSASFLWSPAVRALTVLLLKTLEHALAGRDPEKLPCLSGEGGTLASTLDYACAKNTAWLTDMFGVDPEGVPYARKVILRTNPERKRPGPVIVSINRIVLDPAKIELWVAGHRVVDTTAITALIDTIDVAKVVSRGRSGPEASVQIAKPATSEPTFSEESHRSGFGAMPIARYHYLMEPDNFDREYARGLELGFFDRRFAFIGEGASQAWLDLCSSPSYTFFNHSLKAIERSISQLVSAAPEIAHFIIDTPGSAVKESVVLQAFPRLEGRTVCLVDSSQEMLHLASSQVAPYCDRLEIFYCNTLVQEELRRIREYVAQIDSRPVGFILLGNYLAAQYQRQAFHRLRGALRPDDRVLIDMNHNLNDDGSNIEEIFEHGVSGYDCPEFHRHIMLTLRPIGVDFRDGVIELEYERDPIFPFAFRISQFFVFQRSRTVDFRGREHRFMKGSRIRLASYFQYSKPLYTQMVHEHGLSIEWEYTEDKPIYFALLKQA